MQITCNTSDAYHVQHVLYNVQRDSSAVKSERAEIAFFLVLFHWLKFKLMTEESGVPGENPRRRASENATYKSLKIQAPTETRTRNLALVVGTC